MQKGKYHKAAQAWHSPPHTCRPDQSRAPGRLSPAPLVLDRTSWTSAATCTSPACHHDTVVMPTTVKAGVCAVECSVVLHDAQCIAAYSCMMQQVLHDAAVAFWRPDLNQNSTHQQALLLLNACTRIWVTKVCSSGNSREHIRRAMSHAHSRLLCIYIDSVLLVVSLQPVLIDTCTASKVL